MKFFDLQIELMVPLWKRVLLVLVCLAWGVVEFVNASAFWGVVFAGLGVFSLWQLFFDGWPASDSAASVTRQGSSDDSAASENESE